MSVYIYFLKIFGFRGLISKTDIPEDSKEKEQHDILEINIDKNHNLEIKNKHKQKTLYRTKYFRIPFNILYITFVLCNIIWPCLYIIVLIIMRYDLKYLYSNAFTYLFLIQYIIGLRYHHKDHFSTKLKKHRTASIIIIGILLLGLIVSITLSIGFILLIVYGINMNLYTDLYNGSNTIGKIFLCISIFINKIYAYNTFFINMITFVTVFTTHKVDIQNYTTILDSYIEHNENGLTIKSITGNYIELKEKYSESINLLNNMFTMLTLFGIIGSFFTIKYYNTSYVDPFHYISIVFFLLTGAIYIYVMRVVKYTVLHISSNVNSSKFSNRFLKRSFLEDLVLLDDAYDKENTEFLNVGPKISMRYVKLVQGTDDNNRKLDSIMDIVMRLIIKISENSEGTDWIILDKKLGGEWEKFNLFGFDIDDDTLMKKIIAIICGIGMILNLYKIIGF